MESFFNDVAMIKEASRDKGENINNAHRRRKMAAQPWWVWTHRQKVGFDDKDKELLVATVSYCIVQI